MAPHHNHRLRRSDHANIFLEKHTTTFTLWHALVKRKRKVLFLTATQRTPSMPRAETTLPDQMWLEQQQRLS